MCSQTTPPSATQEQYLCLAGIQALWGCEQINLVAVQVIDVTAGSMGLVSVLLTKSRPLLGVAYAVWYPSK